MEEIIVSEINQTQKNKYYMIPLSEASAIAQLTEAEEG